MQPAEIRAETVLRGAIGTLLSDRNLWSGLLGRYLRKNVSLDCLHYFVHFIPQGVRDAVRCFLYWGLISHVNLVIPYVIAG
jgi:hypothetical protein